MRRLPGLAAQSASVLGAVCSSNSAISSHAMEHQRFLTFLVSLAVFQIAVMDTGSISAHGAAVTEITDVKGKTERTEEGDVTSGLPITNSLQPATDAGFLEENGDFFTSFPTQPDGGNSRNGRMVERDINGTTTGAKMGPEELEQAIHTLNMKIFQGVFMFLAAIAETAIAVIFATKWRRNRTRMYRGRVAPTPVDAESLRVKFCNLHYGNHL